ncbi:MAG: hypothetical protein HYX20_03970 [Candidatus Yanofskybacteria bacterium]|nr:hypothetical protein [Candidatus Yanofskybacteria bacterium]
MINQQLLDYIKQQLAAGYDKQGVKQALLDAGWAEQDINEVFDFFSTSGHSAQQPIAPNQIPTAEQNIDSVFLGPTKLLSNAWALYKQRFWTLIAIALIPTLAIIPAVIGSTLIYAFIFSKIIAGGSLLLILIMFALAALVMFLVQFWGQAALMFAIVNNKEEIGFIESYRKGWHKILSLWWVTILMAFVTLGGYLLAIIPGIIFTVWFSLSALVLIAENSRGMDALLKSREYVRGRWWTVLGRNIFIGLFYFVVFLISTLLFLFVFKVPLVSQVVNFIIIITLAPLALIYMFLMYQNLRSLRGEVDLAPTKKSRTTFIIIAVLGIVAIFALLFWVVFPTFSTLRQLSKTLTNVGDYNPTVSPGTTEMADWQTYRNEEYGFKVKYPSGWITDDLTPGKYYTLLLLDNKNEVGLIINPDFKAVKVVDLIALKNGFEEAKSTIDKGFRDSEGKILFEVGEIKQIVFAGESALEVMEINPSGFGESKGIYFISKDRLFRISRVLNPTKNQELNQILSTFKFISPEDETVTWAVYSNTKYNYSFRYPKNFTIYTATDQTKEEVILPTATSDKVKLTDRKEFLFCCESLVTSVSVINGSIDTQNWRQYAEIPDYRIKSQGEIVFASHKAFEVRGSTGIDSAGARLILIPGSQFSFVLIQGDEGEPWESITNSFSFK